MVDNVAITAGTGTTIAADDIGGGVLVQRVKSTWGPDGTANDTDVASGKPMPVQLRTAGGVVLGDATTPVINKISDGTNVAAVKAASTAPAATDPAVVVAVSPNSWDLTIGTGGAKTPRFSIDTAQLGSLFTTDQTKSASFQLVGLPSDQAPVATKGNTITQAASSTITRPADTTAYTSGDLVANSVTAGSVANLQFTTLARVSGGSGLIVGAQIQKSTAGVTNAAFRLHLFNTAPTYTSAGDNSAISTVVVASAKGYLGYIDITAMVAFSDVAWGSGAPDNTRGSIPYVATAQIIYGLIEARGAYTPGNAEVFTITLDALQD